MMLAQREELSVLESIYGDMMSYFSDQSIGFSLPYQTVLKITLPNGYPEKEPPTYVLSSPMMSLEQKVLLENMLNEAAITHLGEPMLHVWIEIMKEFAGDVQLKSSTAAVHSERTRAADGTQSLVEDVCPDITSSAPYTEKRSTFQAHLALLNTKEDVSRVLSKLKSNNKIANASHNMYAWHVNEIRNGQKYSVHDCNDDGESGAGTKMLEVLMKIKAENVIVVVSRWFGGVHLGPQRFRIINNMTRMVLKDAGFGK